MVRKVSKKLHRTHKKKYYAVTKRVKNKSIRTKRRSRKMRYDRGVRGGEPPLTKPPPPPPRIAKLEPPSQPQPSEPTQVIDLPQPSEPTQVIDLPQNDTNAKAFLQAVKDKNPEEVNRILDELRDDRQRAQYVNFRSGFNDPALFQIENEYDLYNESRDEFKKLNIILEKILSVPGINLKLKNNYDETILWKAAEHGSVKFLKKLLEHKEALNLDEGSKSKSRSYSNTTPLEVANKMMNEQPARKEKFQEIIRLINEAKSEAPKSDDAMTNESEVETTAPESEVEMTPESDDQTQLQTTPTKNAQKKAEELCIEEAFKFFEKNCYDSDDKTIKRLSDAIREKANTFYARIIKNIENGLHLNYYNEEFGLDILIDKVEKWNKKPFTQNYPLGSDERLNKILSIEPCPRKNKSRRTT